MSQITFLYGDNANPYANAEILEPEISSDIQKKELPSLLKPVLLIGSAILAYTTLT